MLELKNISKSYTTGEFTQIALDNVSLEFRKNEFVSILGPSGSGKTTCLNILGGLDKYDSGDLIINGKSTKNFKDRDWDAYRNNSVGFVFQSYNLINHLSVIDNVELGMTLSGVSNKEKRKKAVEVLTKVGLKDHIYKRPNQLSGGQMQRVAIARALANDPDIIMADEPTGALDSETSLQIMDLIKEISKDKLVVMVTHNEELAEDYSDRIINLLDGEVISDTNPIVEELDDGDYELKKTSMSFFTALKLSGKNIWAKKWRTLLTAFASSIGIIGIALILSLSNGFDEEIKKFESDTLSGFPIMIMKTAEDMDMDSMKEQRDEMIEKSKSDEKFTKENKLFSYDKEDNVFTHHNKLTGEYLEYIENIDNDLVSGISYTRLTDMNIVKSDGQKARKVDSNVIGLKPYPKSLDGDEKGYLEKTYDLLAGEYPKDSKDLVLIVDSFNRIDKNLLEELGIESKEELDFESLVGYELRSIPNNIYYKEEGKIFRPNYNENNLIDLYNHNKSKKLKITGILRIKEDTDLEVIPPGIAYSEKLMDEFLEESKDSDIIKKQREVDYNILTGQEFVEEDESGKNIGLTRDYALALLGGKDIPQMITIYPKDFESKDKILTYLQGWNVDRDEDDSVLYTDLASTFTDLTGEIMGAITLVLIAFASISLVVSLIMIGIITYISVLERTKEIGVLRALGARKKDITRVFNAETFIIGAFSGALALGITFSIIPFMNSVLYDMTNLESIAKLNPLHAVILVVINIALTLLGGFIPAKMASKQDPVNALRDE